MIHAKNCEKLPKYVKVAAKILPVPFLRTRYNVTESLFLLVFTLNIVFFSYTLYSYSTLNKSYSVQGMKL